MESNSGNQNQIIFYGVDDTSIIDHPTYVYEQNRQNDDCQHQDNRIGSRKISSDLPNLAYWAWGLPDEMRSYFGKQLVQNARTIYRMKFDLIYGNPSNKPFSSITNSLYTLFMLIKQNENAYLKNEALSLLLMTDNSSKTLYINILINLGITPIIVECLNSEISDIAEKAARVLCKFIEF